MFAAGAVTRSQLDQAQLSNDVSANDLKSAVENYKHNIDQLAVDLQNAKSNLTSSGEDPVSYTHLAAILLPI